MNDLTVASPPSAMRRMSEIVCRCQRGSPTGGPRRAAPELVDRPVGDDAQPQDAIGERRVMVSRIAFSTS